MGHDLPLIIVNPRSGRGTTEKQWASIAGIVRSNFGPYQFEFTRERGDAIRIAEEESKKQRPMIIAMGGDGTISEVATGILQAGTGTVLGILPRGTGGDLRRSLKIPADLAAAARHLRDSAVRSMDVGKISYIDHQGLNAVRYFVNTASFGMSGRVAGKANESSKWLGGKITFAAATLQSTLTHNNPEVILRVNGGEARRVRIASVCVANGRYWGGGMKIAPDARVNDGIFDVVIIGDFGALEILLKSYRLYSGTHLELDKVGLMKGSRIEALPVNEQEPVFLEVDGETPGRLPATIEVQPGALRLRC
jgi:YegS/Rv2252/BmrU family lipid kinase